MEKKILSLMVLLVAVSSLVMAAGSVCTDSDPTNSPFIKGRVDLGTGISDIKWDYCLSGKVLYEMTCEGGFEVSCERGCSDGKCRAVGDTSTLITECYDTDPADDPYIKGTVNAGINLADTKEDYCYDKWNLFEQNCEGGKIVPCEYGCSSGECNRYGSFATKPEARECLDSDGGLNWLLKGRLSVGEKLGIGVQEDYCMDTKTLIEKTCEGNFAVDCEGGDGRGFCADGRCRDVDPTEKLASELVGSTEAILKAPKPKLPPSKQEKEEEEPIVSEPEVEAPSFMSDKTWLWIAIIVIIIAIIYFSSTKKKKK